jgi:hypothetical protein
VSLRDSPMADGPAGGSLAGRKKGRRDVLYDERDRTACSEYEATLEDYLEGPEDSATTRGLTAHLERCSACREALEAARLGRELLRNGLEPAGEPSGAFATRVAASIRAEEGRRLPFWRPLEILASRLALSAVAALLMLGVYLFQSLPSPDRGQVSTQGEVSEALPEPAREPANKDEVLLTLAGSGYER